MEISDKGSLNILPQLIRDNQTAPAVREKGEREVGRSSGEATQVSISPEARHLQRVAELAKQEGELRAEKVNGIKEQILQGEYHVEAIEVAKSAARSEVSRLLGRQ
jgi:flagellar biosynthesis anti-sigma factor FlgM